MQIALNYGKAKYYTEPLLTVQAAQTDFPEYSINDLVPVLIQDLEPVKHVEKPGAISLGVDMNSGKLFFPIPLLLGDLYLWNGQYENAAREYYFLIEKERYVINERYTSTWTVDNGVFVSRPLQDQRWPDIFVLTNNEQITLISGTTQMGDADILNSLCGFTYEIAPSSVAVNNWDGQTYYYNENATIPGDLRGNIGSYFEPGSVYASYFAYSSSSVTGNMISKYPIIYLNSLVASSNYTTKAVMLYRVATLYLRYAEAVNRTGKPNLAFAVLKNGMNADNLALDSIVPRREKYVAYTDTTIGAFIDYANFNNIVFDNNIGVHARGCGNVDRGTDFIIPSLNSLQDSIDFVEDKIIEELALETAFEGNRFQDLMRVAIRRNDPSFLADKVAAKHKGSEEAFRSKLMDETNWYIKK